MNKEIQQLNTTTFKTVFNKYSEVEIGDKDKADFKPTAKLKKWGDECFIKISLPTDKKIKPIQENGKLKWKDDKREVHFYTKKQTVERRSGQALELKDNYDVKIEIKEGIRHLMIDGVSTMSNSELEIAQAKKGAREAFGDVLIGGLGLGMIQKILLENPKVKSITTIEISQEVIDLIKKESPELFNEKHKVIKDDFYSFCQKTDLRFDYIYNDIWSSLPSIDDWNKFREYAEPIKREGGIIDCWQKEETIRPLEEKKEEAFEFEIILKEKPPTPEIAFDIELENVKYKKQPQLTQKEIDNGAFRPKNVVGGIVFWHATKGNIHKEEAEAEKYKTSRIGMFYRPKLVDANGWEVWGDLKIENGKLKVKMPDDFWNNAVYPVYRAAGLLFGYDTQGGTTYGAVTSLQGSLFAGVAGTATKISACIEKITVGTGGTTSTARCGIYQHSDGDLIDNGLSNLRTEDFTTKAFYDFTFPTNPTVAAVDYVLTGRVFWGGGDRSNSYTCYFYYDEGAADQGHHAGATWDDPITWTSHNTNKYSIYVTYEAAATTDIKSYNGLLKASIKSVNGLAIASIKSINGLE